MRTYVDGMRYGLAYARSYGHKALARLVARHLDRAKTLDCAKGIVDAAIAAAQVGR